MRECEREKGNALDRKDESAREREGERPCEIERERERERWGRERERMGESACSREFVRTEGGKIQ